MSPPAPLPELELYSQIEIDDERLDWIKRLLGRSIPVVLKNPGTETAVLPGLEVVEVTLISDESIAEVHGEFLDDPTPTDVITFHHGEILVSEETARREASQFGKTVDEEIVLYGIHGFLHLNGHIDHRDPERAEMHRIQEDILSRILVEDARNR